MKCFYADHFVLPLPPGHRFPMPKYVLLRERLITEGVIAEEAMFVPEAATDEQLLRCHTPEYLERMTSGMMTDREMRRIGFPWSPFMVERSRRSTGATIAACRAAITDDDIAANLAGGTHHACSDHGEGYCVFNDAAVAARAMQAEGLAGRVVIIDYDVHQGNGTSEIVADDPTIFSFSIHGEKNFPFRKVSGDLDIGLPDGTTDAHYLDMVEEGTRRALLAANADFAIYISGADAFEGDRLGKLAISKAGLAKRDGLVVEMCRTEGLPIAIAMGGGYADNIEDIVDIHYQTIKQAAQRAKAWAR